MRSSRTPLLVLLCCLLVLAPAALAQKAPKKKRIGKLEVPPATERGSFTGTWYRVQPGQRQALQVREAPGGEGYELRLYWRGGEGFEVDTGWSPRHEFVYRGFPGLIVLEPRELGDGRFVLEWRREQEGARGSKMVETGDVEIFRVEDGRKLVWLQRPLHRKVTVAEPMAPHELKPHEEEDERIWIMRKATRRLVPWDEIPW
jgi:hypothetical protein